MSEFIAEAQVLVRPNTALFRSQLITQLATVTKGVTVPVTVTPVVTGGVASLAGATTGLTAAQQKLIQSSQLVAGAQSTLAASTQKSTAALLGAASASSRLDAALLGLRTAVGSSAVIGLGALALAAIAAGQAIRGMLAQTASFQQELSTFRATAEATAEEMEQVREAAIRLGADVRLPAVSATDAAIAMTELAKAGLTVQEAIAGAEGVLQLATAAQLSNADAAKIAANALNSFGLAGDQATRVADDFANAANAAQGSIADIGIAFGQASAVARQVGLSLEDTTAILSLFAKNGLQGSDAGTALRVALIRLVAPSREAAAEIKKLGLNIRDASGNVRPDVFAQFGEATRDLAPAARDAAAALIFGQDAIRAVAIGAREGRDGLELMQFQIDKQGTAAELAAARTEGLAGSFAALQSNLQTLGVELGSIVAGPLKVFLDSINNAIATTSQLITNLSKLGKIEIPPIEIDVGVTLSFGGRAGTAGDIADKAKDVVSNALGQALAQVVLSPATTSALRAKVIVEAIAGIGRESDASAEKVEELNTELRGLQEARIQAKTGGAPAEFTVALTKRIEELKREIAELKAEGAGLDAAVTSPFSKALAELQKLRDIRLDLGRPTADIDRFIDGLQRAANEAGRATQRINDLPDGITEVGLASQRAAGGVDALTQALANLGRQAAQSQAELLRLQTEGGTRQQQISVLEDIVAQQRAIIEKIKSDGNQLGDASAIEEARRIILSALGQIESLQNEITAATKKAADDAEANQKERQSALERVLAAQLQPKERLLSRAAGTESLRDDIKFREIIIGILRAQIEQIRKTLGDTQAARLLIKSIQDRILTEVLRLKKDRQDFRRQLREALEERLERAQRGTQLDIELADINENQKRQINLRLRLIAQIKKEIRVLKLQGNALKEKRNEIARLRKEIEDIRKEEKETAEDARKSAAQFFFEQLQAQQGFAANLLGNLIPRGQTAGLVGVPSPTPEREIRGAAAAATGRAQIGVTAGQANTQVTLLQEIIKQLRILNGSYDAPEAIHQKKVGSSTMDSFAM